MKRKYAAVMLGLALTISSLNVYAAGASSTDASTESTENAEDTTSDETSGTDTTADEAADAEEDVLAETVSGEVKAVEEDSITISVGTLKNHGGAPGMDDNKEKTHGEAPEGEKPADSEAAAETDAAASNTEDKADSDEALASADEASEMADAASDEASENTNAASDEKMPEEGVALSMLELTGEEQTITITEDTVVQREMKPELPAGEAPDEAMAPEENADSSTEAAQSAKADSTDADIDAAQEDTSNEDTSDSSAADATDAEEVTEAAEGYELMKTEPMELTDIVEGDIVTITLDEDGNAAMITVLSQGMNGESVETAEDSEEETNSEADKSAADAAGTDASGTDTANEDTAEDSAE